MRRFVLVQLSYYLRRITHYFRMKHIERGVDWRFYEQYSTSEIIRMKIDGTEQQKLEMWSRRR